MVTNTALLLIIMAVAAGRGRIIGNQWLLEGGAVFVLLAEEVVLHSAHARRHYVHKLFRLDPLDVPHLTILRPY